MMKVLFTCSVMGVSAYFSVRFVFVIAHSKFSSYNVKPVRTCLTNLEMAMTGFST